MAAYAAYAVITVWFLFDRSLRFFYGYAALVVLVLLLSGQRQETLGVVLGIAAVYAVKHRHNVLVWLFPAAGAVLLAYDWNRSPAAGGQHILERGPSLSYAMTF